MTARKANPSRDRLPIEVGEMRKRKLHIDDDGRVHIDITVPASWAMRASAMADVIVEVMFDHDMVTIFKPE